MGMLLKRLKWQTLVFPAAVRLSTTAISKNCKRSLQTTDAPLIINSVRIPISGSFARVGYADFGRSDDAVCLALHGALSGIAGMVELAPSVLEAGFRLVIPEFPGYGYTEMEDENAFDQSTESRAELVHNFLSAIKVNRVAAVVGHSMGSVLALHLAANTDLCQSAVFLNGLGIIPHRGLRPVWLLHSAALLLRNSVTGPLASRLLKPAFARRGISFQTEAELKPCVLSLAKVDFQLIRDDAERIHAKQLPILSALTQNDRLLEWEIPVNLARLCGATDGQITFFDENEQAVSGPRVEDTMVGYPRVLVFARGGHFVHRSHTDIVTDAVIQLMTHVSNGNNATAAVPGQDHS